MARKAAAKVATKASKAKAVSAAAKAAAKRSMKPKKVAVAATRKAVVAAAAARSASTKTTKKAAAVAPKRKAATPKSKAVASVSTAKSPKRGPETTSKPAATVVAEEKAPQVPEQEDNKSKTGALPGKRQSVWGPFWSYSQCSHNVDEESHQRHGTVQWPEGVVPEEGKWVFWLPDGWGQGVKTTSGGRPLKVYVSPSGKVFYHKVDVQNTFEQKLPEKDSKPYSHVNDVDLATFRPSWPKKDWLPKDWFICYKKLPNRLCKCFVSPDQSGYAYHKFSVLDYLSGKTEKLTPVSGKIIMDSEMENSSPSPAKDEEAARTLDFNEEA